ncbi:Uncharacterised protein [Burkholderia pseudomallei]|nr:Uncharacterised protein [Burkholderia pseudomallei]
MRPPLAPARGAAAARAAAAAAPEPPAGIADACGAGRSDVVAIHTSTHARPIAHTIQNAGRQPSCAASTPTIGPASAPPSGEPALSSPIAVAADSRGSQLLTILFAAEQSGPSAMPNSRRTISRLTKPIVIAVIPQKIDQRPTAIT